MPRRRKDEHDTQHAQFAGFERPESNYFKMPNSWTDITAEIDSIAQLKVVEYILRHTWGYQEFNVKKHITIDEFVHGRKRVDGTRLDKGTGLSERAVYDGLRKAVDRGFIEEDVDDSDRGRVKKSYCLRMRLEALAGEVLQSLQPGVHTLHPPLQSPQARGAKGIPRTEKDTLERYPSNIRKASRSKETDRTDPEQSGAPQGGVPGFEKLRETMRRQKPPGREHDEDRQVIGRYLMDFSRDLGDNAPLRSSVTRAVNLLHTSGVHRDTFVARMFEAKAKALEEGKVRNRRDGSGVYQPPARMALWFACLEEVLGLQDDSGSDRSHLTAGGS